MRSAHPQSNRRPAIRMRSAAVAVASALAGTAWANPGGPSVAAGSASFSASGNTLNITNTPGTIINWQQFSIRPDEVTRFIQSGAMSAVLNRVVTAEQSQILGQLLSNGRVFLINPNGVTVGAGARIDTAGFIASSLNISDADFLSGRMRFAAVNGAGGKVVNEGTINASSGGSVYLIAPSVENHGVITAPNGDVLLAAGKSVEVVASTSPHIRVEITAPAESEALNVGQVVGGRIGIYGGLVRNAGTLNATTAMVGENGNIILKSSGDVRLEGGVVKAAAVDGGNIRIEGDRVVQGAAIDASGASGGSVSIQANTVLQSARVDAQGTNGRGGVIDVQSTGSLVQTAGATLDASGATAGGNINVQGTGERRVFSSGTLKATSSAGQGGEVRVLGEDVVLAGAHLDASGETGGGRVLIGGDFHGANPDVPNAAYVTVTGTTSVAADARRTGNGGDVVVWADNTATFAGAIAARGGARSGDGGRVEVSGKQSVSISGRVDASAPNGAAGTLLIDPKNITIAAVAPSGNPVLELNDPTPGPNENFGQDYVVVNGTHAVVTDPNDNAGFGAAYIFDVAPGSPTQGQLLSTIVGSTGTDQVGSGGITTLSTGNVIISSPSWSNNGTLLAAGALTFGAMNAATPTFAAGGGIVSAGNSLVGGQPNAAVANATLDEFVSGSRFALVNSNWNLGVGAVTFGDAVAGMPVGVLSNANSMVGTNANDQIGVGGVTTVGFGSGVVITSHFWNSSRGAVTYVPMTAPLATPGDGTIAPIAGTTGDVTAGNSLTGAQPSQFIGTDGGVSTATQLANGNYLVYSPGYSGAGGTETGAGAITWVNGASGIPFGESTRGAVVSGTNSLRGNVNDQIGSGGITQLIGAANGNVVISSPNWGGGVGASTWMNGATGAAGTVTAANSLTGSTPGDFVSQFVHPLSNGNYVLVSPLFANSGGAATLVAGVAGGGGQPIVNGATQTIAPIDATNSLLGGGPNAFVNVNVQELFDGATNANSVYALFTPGWNDNAGAITLSPLGGTGAGPVGTISGTTSLIGSVSGSTTGDRVGSIPFAYEVGPGRYFLSSPQWSNGGSAPSAGAMTPIDLNAGPAGRPVGAVTAGNSIVGQTAFDFVDASGLRSIGGDRWVLLAPNWDNGAASDAGAIRLIDASTPSFITTAVGALSSANSLVGTNVDDRVGDLPLGGFGALQPLSGGEFLIASPNWNDGRGALTFFNDANAATQLTGTVSATNSLVGTTGGGFAGDRVGTDNPDGDVLRVLDLGGGFYAVPSLKWTNGAAAGAGAVTLVNTAAGTPTGPISNGTGVVSAANSIVGSSAGDSVGEMMRDLGGGRFATGSYLWDNGAAVDAGAVTLANAAAWTPFTVGAANSLVGSQANDQVGFDSIAVGGRLAVLSPDWSNGAAASAGAVTVLDPATFVGGAVSAANSLVGTATNDQVGNFGAALVPTQPNRFYVVSPSWSGNAGAVTFMSAAAPVTGAVSAANSLVGASAGDAIGIGGADVLTTGNLLLRSPNFNGNVGALTFVNASGAPPVGVVGATNSLVGSAGNPIHNSGQYDIRQLSDGGYIVVNQAYNAGGGMIVYGSAAAGAVGTPGPANGWIGAPGDNLGQHIEILPGNEFVFNAPNAAKGADVQAGRLFIAKPGGLGGVPFNGSMLFGDPGSDPSPTVISAAQIAGFLDAGTQVLLQAGNDIVVNAAIGATGVTNTSGLLRMQAGRSILVNADITNLNQDAAGQSIHLTANDATATGARDPGPGELRMAPNTTITGGGSVRLEVGDGTGAGTAGGLTVANVSGTNVDLLNVAVNRVPDAARPVDLLPGSVSSASQTFNITADGDVRFGPLGGAGATAQGGSGTFNVNALGAITGGTGTLINLAPSGIGPINLTGASIGTPAQAFGLQHGSQGVVATSTTGGIHVAQTAGTTDTAFYSFDAPAGQAVDLGSLGGAMNVAGVFAPANGNPVRLYTTTGDINLQSNPTITAPIIKLQPGGGQVVATAGATLNGPVEVTTTLALQGGTTTFGGGATLGGLSLTGNGTVLDMGAGPVGTGTLSWGSGTIESNTVTGGTGSTLTVSGTASISGQGTRSLDNASLVLANGANATYGAGTGSFLLGGTGGIDNAGTFNIFNGNTFDSSTGLLHAFINRASGVVGKTGGTATAMGSSAAAGVALNNQGVVNVAGGDVVLNTNATHTGAFNVASGRVLTLNGAQTLQAASSVTGPGTVSVAAAGSALAVNGAMDVGGLDVANGVVTINSAVASDGYSQSGGTVGGPGDLTVRQAFSLTGGTFGSAPFGNLYINQASGNLVFNTASPTASLKLTAPVGAVDVTSAVNVSGAVEYFAGVGVTVNSTTNAASLKANTAGGSVIFTGPVAVTGAAELSGAFIDVSAIFGAGSLDASFAGANISFDAPVNVAGAASINGDTVNLNGALTAGSVRAFTTFGAVGVNAPIVASGTVELGGAAVNVLGSVSGSSITLVSPSVTLGNVTLTGPIDASAASVSIPDGSAVTLNGNGNVFRDVGMGGNATSLVLTGANTITGNFAWQGTGISSISGGSLTLNGSTAIGGDGVHILDNVQVANNGTLMFGPTFLAGGPLVVENGATLTNNATFDLQNDQPIVSTVGTGTLRNVGTLVKNATQTGTTLIGDPTAGGTLDFINTGGVQVNAGNIEFGQAPSVAQAGSYSMGPVGGLIFSNGTHTLNGVVTGGTLGVSGTATVTIANTGTLNANTMAISGGALAIDGTANTGVYDQTGGVVGGTGNLFVGSSFSQTGGSFGNQFNVLSVTQASGDISGAGFGAIGQLSLAAPAGAVNITTPLSLAGAASFFGGTGINVSAPITAASVGMVTGGTASISNATVNATSGAITVSANQVQVTAGTAPAGLIGAGGLAVASLNDVIVQGGTGTNATAELNAGNGPLALSAQRDLKVLGGSGANASARVIGNPDAGSAAVPIKVGGEIVMEQGTGTGATARIESVSANSIYVNFPNAASGGYTVNGLAATSDNGSGFYAGGVPAILDQNLWITYGIPATVQIDPGTLVTALNRSTEPLDATVEEERRHYLESLFGDIDDVPICK